MPAWRGVWPRRGRQTEREGQGDAREGR